MSKYSITKLFYQFFSMLVLLALILSVTPAQQAHAATVLYVMPTGLTSGTCDSWENACDLQYALGQASSGDEIWVAHGKYKPTIGTNRSATFQLITGVEVYGGFYGQETARDQRGTNPAGTVLSGDIGVVGEVSDNSYHVVTGSGTDGSAVLDGFLITGGNASGSYPDDRGGGMISIEGSPSTSNLIFEDNSARTSSGGMYNRNNSPHLLNITFRNNKSDYYAGGLGNAYSDALLVNVTFIGNIAGSHGGGILNYYCDPSLVNVSFTGNISYQGAGIYNDNSNSTLVNASFNGNIAENYGNGIFNVNSFPVIHNSILWDTDPNQLYNDATSQSTITYSDVFGGCPTRSLCTEVINSDPLFVNSATGNLRLNLTSPAIDAGDNTQVPIDSMDMDNDGNTIELLPYDLSNFPRFMDISEITDTGNGTSPIVDMGAYERSPMALTGLDLLQTTDPDLGPWLPVPGSYANGFAMLLDPVVPYYYLDTDTITTTQTIADDYYPFYIQSYPAGFFEYWAGRDVDETPSDTDPWKNVMWKIINGDLPIFYLKVTGDDYMLVDGLIYEMGGGEQPLKVDGTYLLGAYTFSGVVTDADGYLEWVSVDIVFNDLPVANGQVISTDEDTSLPITLTVTDIYSSTMTWAITTPPTYGTLDGVAPDLTYTPNPNYNSTDSFNFRANDGFVDSNIATINITINPVNDAPVAQGDAYTTDEDTPLSVNAALGLLHNDTDIDGNALTAVLNDGPDHGLLTLNQNGSFVYTPEANYNSTDSFTYHARDGSLNSGIVTVSLTINPVNDAPVAQGDAYTTDEDTPLSVSAALGLLHNDADIDGNPLTAVLDDGPDHGLLTLNQDGSFVYTPAANYNSSDSFTYHARDGSLNSGIVTVSLVITPVNDAPIVNAGPDKEKNEGDQVAFTGNYSDPDWTGGTIKWNFGDGNTQLGTLTPVHNYVDEGIYTVTLTITDSEGIAGYDWLVVNVNNVAPHIAELPDMTVLVNDMFTITGVVTDPGLLDTHQVIVAWTSEITQTLNLLAGETEFRIDHTYAEIGEYPVMVTITDNDGGTSTQSFTVIVTSANIKLYMPIITK